MPRENAIAGPISGSQRIQSITEKIIVFSLLMYAIFAPHSIAITQGSYLLGMSAWLVQLFVSRKFRQIKTPVDIALFGFFACCVVSSFFSYDVLNSITGLRSPAFFLAFYFVSNKIKDLKFARLLVTLIIASCLVNVAYSAGQLAVGRGLRIDHIKRDSAFAGEGLEVGDVILEADGEKVASLEDLSRIAALQRGRMKLTFERNEAISETSVSRRAIKESGDFGITTSPGRNFRIMGLYSHYETYAEVLQIIAALAIGMLIANPNKKSAEALFLIFSILLIAAALILTSTRAALAGLAVGTAIMAFASTRRRALLITVLAILLLAPIAYLVMKHSRGEVIFNWQEESAAYRLEIWREAMSMIKDHPLTGIGKGSDGSTFVREKYALYDGGKLPPGHFHSTIIQVPTWWGLPALAFYIAMMTIFFRDMWRLSHKLRKENQVESWGIVLGGIGALAAFNVSSLVHFNFGDGEVVMMLWLFLGIVFAVRHLTAAASQQLNAGQLPPLEEDSRKNLPRQQERISGVGVRVLAAKQHSKPQ